MITVTVERSGLDIRLFAEQFQERVVKPVVEALADRAEEIMREKAPVRTGTLRASIQKRVEGDTAIIGPTVPYAVYVEYGTRPHEILPVHARALRFEVEGNVVFAMRVMHPGTRPKPFIRETADQIIREAPDIITRIFREAVRG